MSDSIQEQIATIDKRRDATMELVAKTVQPLARVAYLLLTTEGTDIGRFRRSKEFRFDKVLIKRVGGRWSQEIEVHYNGQLVLHFNDHLSWISRMDREDKRKYLFYFKSGEWKQILVEKYRQLASMNLRQNFDIDGELCDWFNHNTGACDKHEDVTCPCEEYMEAK